MASLQKRTVKGHEYWSLVESKRINGKPTPVVIEYFGNTKSFAEKLMDGRNENKILKSYSHGATYTLLKIAERLGVEQILDDSFKPQTRLGMSRSKSLLLIALQSVCNPASKSELDSWLKSTTLPYDQGINTNLSSDHFWKQMNDITESEIEKAEDTLTQKIVSQYSFGIEKIALDYTNYHTYISSSNDRCSLAKRGRNKQKRNDLRQFSMALITTRESGLPLCSYIYEGNKNDQTAFSEYMEVLKRRIPNYDPNVITLVFDGGSNTKKNFEALETHYICSFSLSSCKNLYDIDLSKYKEVCLTSGKKVNCYRLIHDIWDAERECILTYSKSLFLGQLKELNEDMDSVTNTFKDYNKKLSNPKSRISKTVESAQLKIAQILKKKYMDTIFEIRIIMQDDGSVASIDYLINVKNKEETCYKYFGKKLLITDRHDWSTAEILQVYREQDTIEKIFRETKDNDHFTFRPQFHFTNQKIRVHIFCCLLGLTLTTILHKKLIDLGYKGSKNKMIDILLSIRRCWIKDRNSNKATYVLEALDDEQSALWQFVQSIT